MLLNYTLKVLYLFLVISGSSVARADLACLQLLANTNAPVDTPAQVLLNGHGTRYDDLMKFVGNTTATFGTEESHAVAVYSALLFLSHRRESDLLGPEKLIIEDWTPDRHGSVYLSAGTRGHLHKRYTDGFCEHTLCHRAEMLFYRVFFDPTRSNIFGKGTVLALPEIGVIGVLKHHEQQTFLALRTVRDSAGRFVLIAGGVYSLKYDLERFLAVQHYEGSYPSGARANTSDLQFATIDELELIPRRFLLPHRFYNFAANSAQTTTYTRADHRVHWPRFLDELEALRIELNTIYNANRSRLPQSTPPSPVADGAHSTAAVEAAL